MFSYSKNNFKNVYGRELDMKRKLLSLLFLMTMTTMLQAGCGANAENDTGSNTDATVSQSVSDDNQDTVENNVEEETSQVQTENQETEKQGKNDNIAKLENMAFKVPTLQEYLDLVEPLIEAESDISENGYQDCFNASGQIVSSKQYNNSALEYYFFYEYREDGSKKIEAKYKTDGSLIFYRELDADEWDVRGADSSYNEDKGYYIINYSAPGVKEQKNFYYADGTVQQITYYKNDITQKIIVYDGSGAEEYTAIYEYTNATDMTLKTITTQYAKDGFHSVEDFTTGDITYYDAEGNTIDYSDFPH